MFFLIFHLLA